MNGSLPLEVQNLSYSFGKKSVLDDVAFSIAPGQCTMLLGPNGAGKTTLFSLVTRLYDNGQGRIRVSGFDLRKQTGKALARLGVVFQQPTLDLDLSVMQNLKYHAALHGISRKIAKDRIKIELQRQDMLDRSNEKVRSLNGGHRRRVEVARALLHDPQILLLDEPTVGLDVPSRQSIVQYLHDLCADKGISVLWATHLIDEVYDADHLVVLHKGKVRETGSVDQVLRVVGVDSVQAAFQRLTQAVDQ